MPKKSNKFRKADLNCQRCHKKWAILSYKFERPVKATDVEVLVGEPFKDDDMLACRGCSYPYTTWDILLAICNPITDKDTHAHKKIRVPRQGHKTKK